MYDEIYSLNYVNSFLISTIFLAICIIFSYIFQFKIHNNKETNFGPYNSIIFFFLIFCIYSIILNLSILINFKFLSYTFSLIFLLKIFYIIKNYKIFFDNFNLKFLHKTKIILFFFIIFYLVSILPMSDADSIVVFQNIPTTIFSEGFKNFNFSRDIEFVVFSNTETLLLISSILKSDNFGAQLNLISLFFLIFLTYKENKNFLLIILSSPLIIYFISAQKLQLFFGILYLLLFILIHKKLVKNKIDLFFVIFLLTFYSSGKITYVLFSIPLFVYLLKNNISSYKTIILYSIISSLIIYLPFLSIKQIYFNNILAPFFDGFFGNNLEIYNAFALSLRSSEGWLSNPNNFYLYLRPFITFDLSKISSSIGLIFLFMIIDYKLQRKLKFIPLILIGLILLTGQILPRYYFEAFLILAFFFNYKIKFIKFIVYLQLIGVLSLTSIFIYISYFELNVFNNEKKYQNQFAYSFYNAQQIKKDSLKSNILDFSLDRDSIYFPDNVYSSRYINIINNFNKNDDYNLINFINKNSIKYLVVNKNNKIPVCIKTKKIKDTIRKKSVRNFLTETKKNNYEILKITENSC